MSTSLKKIIYGFEGFGGAEAISQLDNVDWYGIGRYSEKVDYNRNTLELFSFTESLSETIKRARLPASLQEKFESRLTVYFDQLSRTRSGRIGSDQEKEQHLLILLKWWLLKYQNIEIEWAFFAAPPHLGVDMLLSDYLDWRGVMVRWGSQSLFAGFYSLLNTQLERVESSGDATRLIPEFPSCESEELFYMQNIKPTKPSKLKWLETFIKVMLRDKRYSLKWANHVYVDGMRYCKQLAQATSNTEKTIEHLLNKDINFVYFPLHLQPEMTTSTLGGIYVDQVLAIEHLHEKLPKGWRIVIKENPKQTFQYRPVSFFKRIQSLSNVDFVGLKANSKLLIKHSKVVATITGTAGWEAIRLQTPVIIFGRAWYENFVGVHSFSETTLIEETAQIKINQNELQKNYEDFVKGCHYGIIDSGYQSLVDFDSDKNIQHLMNLFRLLSIQSKQ